MEPDVRTQRRRAHFAFARVPSLLSTSAPLQAAAPLVGDFTTTIDAAAQRAQNLLPQLLTLGPQQTHAASSEQQGGPKPPWLKAIPSNKNAIRQSSVAPDESGAVLCVELTNGRRRVYRKRGGAGWEGWDMVEAAQTTKGRLINLFKSYILPQGFPESVAPQYASYMGWRGVQYFFGGAISVYTTKSLLGALGVAGRYSGEASAAINWVIKDGAGRLGRLLFARWGRELDCELKQFRLAGDLLMEGGAALELATIAAPQAFLPLACTANLAKNLAAVAASATRAPIYRTFALQNNLADITAKGESVANLADILGTVAGIVLSKMHRLPMLPTFMCLSAGYLVASRKEVDSVELPYLNRARLGYSMHSFLSKGTVPSIEEANHSEPLLPGVGFNANRIVLGASVEAACLGPSDLRTAMTVSKDQRFFLSYRPDKRKVHILLKEGASSLDCLRAVASAHVFLYLLDGKPVSSTLPGSQALSAASATGASAGSSKSAAKHKQREQQQQQQAGPLVSKGAAAAPTSGNSGSSSSSSSSSRQQGGSDKEAVSERQQRREADWQSTLATSARLMESLYPEFTRQAERQGWKLSQTMLNPKETRLVKLMTPL